MRMALFKLTNGTKELRYVDYRMTPKGFIREYASEDWYYAIVKLRGKLQKFTNSRLQQLLLDFNYSE